MYETPAGPRGVAFGSEALRDCHKERSRVPLIFIGWFVMIICISVVGVFNYVHPNLKVF